MSGKHTERSQVIHIDVDDHEYGQVTPIKVSRGAKAAAVIATAAALTAVGVAHESGNSEDDTSPSDGHHLVMHNAKDKKAASIPSTITYVVGKHDRGGDDIGAKFTDDYTHLKEVSADVLAVDPIIHRGDELQIPTEHMDPDKVAAYESENSAQH